MTQDSEQKPISQLPAKRQAGQFKVPGQRYSPPPATPASEGTQDATHSRIPESGTRVAELPTVFAPAITRPRMPPVALPTVPPAALPPTPPVARPTIPPAALPPTPATARPMASPIAMPKKTLPLIDPLSTINSDILKQVKQYQAWLQQNNALSTSADQIQTYRDAALEAKQIGSQSVCTFAPFQEETSAFRVITKAQINTLLLLACAWITGLFLLHITMITITIGIITSIYILGFLTSGVLVTKSFGKKSGEVIDEEIIHALDRIGVEWPSYTILCPLYKEVAVVPQFVEAIRSLDYPSQKLQVLFLTEQNDAQTRIAIEQMRLPANFTILTAPKGTPQTKPRACNFGLLQAKGQFVVIFDAEDKPEPYQLKKAVLTFANHGPDVACVQAKLNYYNTNQNLLTRWFTAEYSTWFDILLPGLQRTGISLPLGGTSNHFRTEVLHALGGWDAFNVTEDCDLGLRISQYRLKTAVVDSTTYEEATSRVKIWLFQRSRWIKGYFQTYLVHTRNPLKLLQKSPIGALLSLQIIVGAWSLVLLINPIMWAFTVFYLIFRPIALYQLLFPGPILYMATFCLIFGNFFYIYVHILGCLRRNEYSLIKWTLFIPIYWSLMSISAYIAFYELIVKPHYWQKTQHGNHLANAAQARALAKLTPDERESEKAVSISMPTMYMLALPKELATTTQRVKAIKISLAYRLERYTIRQLANFHYRINPWLIALLMLTIGVSLFSTWYSFQHHDILLYGDAYSHMLIARSVIDSISPGFGQLGGEWLPLPQLLMVPLIWNNFLWQTGLAGSIPSMIGYVITTTFLFLAAKRLTKSDLASFAGALIFVLNPNVVYLQTTPLSECVCFATIAMTGYFFLVWAQEDHIVYLVLAGIAAFFATVTRFDGWALSVSLFVLAALIECIRRHHWKQIEATLLLIGLLGSLGIILWFVWNKVIFGDPLHFLHSVYSSQSQTHTNFAQSATVHNVWESIRYYGFACFHNLGPVTCILGIAALVKFMIRRERFPEMLATLCYLAPLSFYIFSFYTGNVNILLPGVSERVFNARFGVAATLPAAIFFATIASVGTRLPRHAIQTVFQMLFTLLILGQYLIITQNGIITLQEGQYGVSCQPSIGLNIYLAQHYNGHMILEDTYLVPPYQETQEVGINIRNVISSSANVTWKQALQNPAAFVDWVIISDRPLNSPYPVQVNTNAPSFQANFTMVVYEQGLALYQKNSLQSLPTRPIPENLLTEHRYCKTGEFPQKGMW